MVSHWVGNRERAGYERLLTKPRAGRPTELTEEALLLDDLVDARALASGFLNDLWDARQTATRPKLKRQVTTDVQQHSTTLR